MKTLVLGAAGMLGQALVHELREGAHEVVAADMAEADITVQASLRGLFEAARPEVVINCAAYTRVDDAESDAQSAYGVNGLGARNAARCCDEVGAQLIHISTDYVFDGTAKAPYEELDRPNPQGVYAKSKRLGEWSVERFCRRFAIVRTSWLFGHGGRNFIDAILKKARDGQPLKVVDDQVGSPTYAPHLARALRQIAENEALGIFHATGQGRCSWFDLAKEALRLAGLEGVSIEPIRTTALNLPAPRPAFSVLANTHLALEGIAALPAWQEGLAAYLSG